MHRILRTCTNLLAVATLGLISMATHAQESYPSRPIRIVVGVAPGVLIHQHN